MKTFIFILLGGLFLFQPAFSSNSSLVVNKTIMSDSKKKIKKPVNIQLLRRESVTRSLPSMIPGYVEEEVLYICFDTPHCKQIPASNRYVFRRNNLLRSF